MRSRAKHSADERRRKHYQKLVRVQVSHRALTKGMAKKVHEITRLNEETARLKAQLSSCAEEVKRWRATARINMEMVSAVAGSKPLSKIVKVMGSDTYYGIQVRALHELLDEALGYIPDDDGVCSGFKAKALLIMEDGV